MRRSVAGIVAVCVLAVVALVGVGGWLAVSSLFALASPPVIAAPTPTCPAADPVTVGRIVVPAGPVAGYCQPQLVNAAYIMSAAQDQGFGTRTQTVGVMTAIGESGLRNLDYGDAAGPDSRGLFQQRDNGAWGTLADRMDPYTAATNFFDKLATIDGWKTMEPTLLAHAVQVNSDPYHYAPYWGAAQEIVTALNGG
jgi:hypothetical protein